MGIVSRTRKRVARTANALYFGTRKRIKTAAKTFYFGKLRRRRSSDRPLNAEEKSKKADIGENLRSKYGDFLSGSVIKKLAFARTNPHYSNFEKAIATWQILLVEEIEKYSGVERVPSRRVP